MQSKFLLLKCRTFCPHDKKERAEYLNLIVSVVSILLGTKEQAVKVIMKTNI